jgi:hypothetical protein
LDDEVKVQIAVDARQPNDERSQGSGGGRDMFVHAEEFDNRQAARTRYLQITGRLRAERDKDLGCYNLLYAGTRPVVAVIAPEAPPADVLAGWSGKPVELPGDFWDRLAQRRRRGHGLDQRAQHVGSDVWIAPNRRKRA